MLGLGILLGFHFLGVLLQHGLGLPLPANVIGLVLFTASLFMGIVKLEWVEASAQFLLDHLLLFFAPVLVGLIGLYPVIERNAYAMVISLVVSTLVSLAAAGWMTQGLGRRGGRRGHE
ncbi:CidA/LrgA family protein [Paenibacillus aurantius]|uniref:CidA/LrgA family protein n=1 Tax=Paenibacillus aurantius TaxID=2918900 RepID=A0AA96L8P5_9BACL|nr:CidA/LrgA family protein [Paenibacillus aurantius]WNQ09144.1 CidA/LrgA family protein [Paenibacillus aurantius]